MQTILLSIRKTAFFCKLSYGRFMLLAASVAAFCTPAPIRAQTIGSITPVLVGSTGNFSIAGGMMLSASTGECIVPTAAAPTLILTQGFQQPSSSTALALSANLIYTSESCLDANDAVATVSPSGGSGPYTFQWSNDTTNNFPVNDSLAPGTYTVTVTDAGGLSTTQTFTIPQTPGICGLHVYSGLTPNGDGHNDTWIIDHLDLFLPNKVTIYNRWGIAVWDGSNYDNQTVVWTGNDLGGTALPDGTYYYVIETQAGNMHGWVELSH